MEIHYLSLSEKHFRTIQDFSPPSLVIDGLGCTTSSVGMRPPVVSAQLKHMTAE